MECGELQGCTNTRIITNINFTGRGGPTAQWYNDRFREAKSCIVGHINWVFNVLPLGRPALSELYHKVAGKNLMHAGIALNSDVVRDLEWLITVIPKAIGVHFVSSTHWDDWEADMVLWTDASLRLGLAFVYSGCGFAYALSPNESKEKIDIFFLELIAILSTQHIILMIMIIFSFLQLCHVAFIVVTSQVSLFLKERKMLIGGK